MRNAKSCGATASPGFSLEIAEPNWSMLTKPHESRANSPAKEKFSPSAISRLACESCKRKMLRSLGNDGSSTRQILPAFRTPMMATNNGMSCSISKAMGSWTFPRCATIACARRFAAWFKS